MRCIWIVEKETRNSINQGSFGELPHALLEGLHCSFCQFVWGRVIKCWCDVRYTILPEECSELLTGKHVPLSVTTVLGRPNWANTVRSFDSSLRSSWWHHKYFHPLRMCINQKQQQQKQTHDLWACTRSFTIGDLVYARSYGSGQSNWIPAHIVQRTGPVSFKVKLDSGIICRRHQDQLRKWF